MKFNKIVDISYYQNSVSVSCEQEPNDILIFDYHNDDETISVVANFDGYDRAIHMFLSSEDSLKLRDFFLKKFIHLAVE